MLAFPHSRSCVCYSKPASLDKLGEDYDAIGHLSRPALEEIGVPRDSDVYICGPVAFMTDMKAAPAGYGVPPERVHIEIFNGGEAKPPGVVGAVTRNPHPPKGDANSTGSSVSFARNGIAAHWNPSVYQSILELAEACDVPVRWACRSGVCHSCESSLVSGAVAYAPAPLDKPAEGNILVCCSQSVRDVVIDL
jgi:ferredoxin